VSPPNPAPILQLVTAYWGSSTLFASNELGVFTALARGPQQARELAAELNVAERPLQFLLQAAAGLGLLTSQDGRFANTELAETYLVDGRPAFLGNAIKYGADNYGLWGGLSTVVRTGKSSAGAEDYLGADPEKTQRFVWGMHSRAVGVARGVVNFIDLPARTTLLDLGGGPGTYSVLLAQKIPGLHAIVFDLPPIVAISREIIASYGLDDRVTVAAGDFTKDDYPAPVGAALLSGMLHREPEDGCRAILGKVWNALTPGGVIILSDVMLNSDKISPTFSTLFALHMLVCSERGGAHAKDEHSRWLLDQGFMDVQVRDLPPPGVHTIITARKP
jgi:3-hydroxy-5-methyl-1-naphthoate 3-O-methyltransferase